MSADVELPHAAARQRRYKAKMRAVLPATLVLLVACASAKPERQGDGYARVTWPQASPVIEYPRVVIHGDGRRTVEDTVPPASLQPLNVAAEAAFHAGDCPKAEERYREILAQSSTFYPALLGLGDCALRGRRAREAIDHYREARRINPDDFLSYFSEADARAKLGNLAEAHELLTQALVLRPRRPTVLGALHAISEHVGVTIDDTPLAPSVLFTGPKTLSVLPERHEDWWVYYALCKHLGCTEREVKRCGIGEREPLPVRPWSVQEETKCLRVAASSYRESHNEKTVDRAFDRFLAADAAGLVDAYVVYEIGSQIDPQIVLGLPPADRKQIDRYVRSFVVVDRTR